MATKHSRRYSSTKFYVWGESLDPEEITALLSAKPDVAWRKGDPRVVSVSRKRTKTLAKNHTKGCWCLTIDQRFKRSDLSRQFLYWRKFFDVRRSALRTLARRGYDMYVDCFVNEGPIFIAELGPQLLATLGGVRIGIRLGFYDSDELFREQSS